MDNTRPNVTAPNGARLRCKLYSDDPGADEARDQAIAALLAAGFTPTAEEPQDAGDMRRAAEIAEHEARIAELRQGRGRARDA